MPRAVVAAYVACALIWGTTWYAIRVSITAYPTFVALALRFAIAAAILLPIAARVGAGRAAGHGRGCCSPAGSTRPGTC
ncbi:MAG TPA: hypothetical protein VGD37_05085 [Kofleriaceae bacterium]